MNNQEKESALVRRYLTEEEILGVNDVFTYHAPKGDQSRRYEQIRLEAKGLAITILQLTPKSPEQLLAIERLREAVMWANSAIAIKE